MATVRNLACIAFHPEALNVHVSFSSCQRNLIKTFQIEAMIALVTKMDLIFHETC